MLTTTQKIANLMRVIIGSDKRIRPVSAIIAAAGSGTRMWDKALSGKNLSDKKASKRGGDEKTVAFDHAPQSLNASGNPTKQHLLIDGIPVVVRSLLAFEECALIGEIILVVREDEIFLYEQYAAQYKITKLRHIIIGGATRQESVLRGLGAINPNSKFVAIHDGARCLVTVEMIEKVCAAAYRYHAAIAATAVRDTVKISGKRNFIEDTADRSHVWLAQTPQVFYTPLYRAAAYSAREEGVSATDDSSLVERIQNPVRLVECGRENIKITTPDDIILAEEILASRAAAADGMNSEAAHKNAAEA